MKILLTLTLLFLLSIRCISQSVYISLVSDPQTLISGIKTDILIHRTDIFNSYSIGKAWFYNKQNDYFEKKWFEEYEIGIGWSFLRDHWTSKDKIIVSPFISYNRKSYKYYNITYGISILSEMSSKIALSLITDVVLWSTKIGIGIKLGKSKQIVNKGAIQKIY